ncbi:hypothetical protein HDU80_008236 [Chytriomyces hyalinus]|nr:hypothetical protein HDU80_008236 [Chytriomyces hyalinus]
MRFADFLPFLAAAMAVPFDASNSDDAIKLMQNILSGIAPKAATPEFMNAAAVQLPQFVGDTNAPAPAPQKEVIPEFVAPVAESPSAAAPVSDSKTSAAAAATSSAAAPSPVVPSTTVSPEAPVTSAVPVASSTDIPVAVPTSAVIVAPAPQSADSSSTVAPQPSPIPSTPDTSNNNKARIVIYTNDLSDAILSTKYTHINVNFWNREYNDWTIDARKFQAAGKKVLISAYGGGANPTSNGNDAAEDARLLAEFVQRNGLDGVDIDWEDDPTLGKGGEQWLIKLTRELRARLPSPQYLISHAPQGPHFSPGLYSGGAYITVDKEAGDMIDFYNIQFYNQGGTAYDDCQCLLFKANGWAPQTSVFEIHQNLGIPLHKLVVGKPVTQAGVEGGSTGYMDPSGLTECFRQAGKQGWNAGAMGWRFGLDTDGTWAEELSKSLAM